MVFLFIYKRDKFLIVYSNPITILFFVINGHQIGMYIYITRAHTKNIRYTLLRKIRIHFCVRPSLKFKFLIVLLEEPLFQISSVYVFCRF